MKFRKDNRLPYWQGVQARHGIPSGIDFTITRSAGMYKLRASGYGARGIYGNGALHVHAMGLSGRQRKRFESEITEA